MVDKAPFSVRPDTRRAGDLLGPFDGIVLEAESERPVAGAVVAASWSFERGVGLAAPHGARELTLETDGDGRYRIPRLSDVPAGLSTRVRRFTLIVYKRGFVAWRSDAVFPTGVRRTDFSQRGNRARLEKWHSGDSHHRHLAFLGGGSAVREASAWEIQPASLELEGGRGTTAGSDGDPVRTGAATRFLDAGPLLLEDEIHATTGYAGTFDVSRLEDLPRTEFYDTRHFKARGQPETFDVAVRVWRLGSPGGEAQYRKVLDELGPAVKLDQIGSEAVRAENKTARAVVFLAREAGVVVSVTCGTAQCTDKDMIVKLAKLVESRLSELPAAALPGDELLLPSGGEGAPKP